MQQGWDGTSVPASIKMTAVQAGLLATTNTDGACRAGARGACRAGPKHTTAALHSDYVVGIEDPVRYVLGGEPGYDSQYPSM
jgi:hypothetical protein